MFTIGEFARLAGVSVRTLRHYDDIGLLRPVTVDPDTGYRGYSAEQLGRLNRVMALKDLGLSLTQARRLLDGITLGGLRRHAHCFLRRPQLEHETAREPPRKPGCWERRPGSATSRRRVPCQQTDVVASGFPPRAWS